MCLTFNSIEDAVIILLVWENSVLVLFVVLVRFNNKHKFISFLPLFFFSFVEKNSWISVIVISNLSTD